MRIASGRREEDFEINVISLIDVMLTLLMFFVMTTTFVQHSSMKVTLPEASTTEPSRDEQTLTVLIDVDGRYYIDNNEALNSATGTPRSILHHAKGTAIYRELRELAEEVSKLLDLGASEPPRPRPRAQPERPEPSRGLVDELRNALLRGLRGPR
jgi:biopolymer transport protein ExbD